MSRKKMKTKQCPQCKSVMTPTIFDVGYGVEVESMHCRHCGSNVTDEEKLQVMLRTLRERMSKEVKVVQVGAGLGIRFPNEIVRNLGLKKGEDVVLKPERRGVIVSMR